MSQEASRAEAGGSAALWFGILAGPLAWGAHLLIGGELPELGCAPGAGAPEVFGITIEALILAATALTAAVAALGGIVSYRCWRRTRATTTSEQRPGWMAMAGIMTSSVFAAFILLGTFPALLLSSCARSL
ncbi:hypothetical protein BH24ACT26_BH24ACT26_18000 [soil metagenome]